RLPCRQRLDKTLVAHPTRLNWRRNSIPQPDENSYSLTQRIIRGPVTSCRHGLPAPRGGGTTGRRLDRDDTIDMTSAGAHGRSFQAPAGTVARAAPVVLLLWLSLPAFRRLSSSVSADPTL